MKKEYKNLLLCDLCGRLPHKVRVRYIIENFVGVGINAHPSEGFLCYEKLERFSNYPDHVEVWGDRIANIIPYLRPMSSMTEEEKKEYNKVMFQSERYEDDYAADVDWLNKHHFDYRGLINKGLALEAPEGMYK